MNDIVEESYLVINKVMGLEAAVNFNALLDRDAGGREVTMDGLTAREQIKYINNFWRKHLIHIENTTEIRCWLCEAESIEAYIQAFESNWIYLLADTGMLS